MTLIKWNEQMSSINADELAEKITQEKAAQMREELYTQLRHCHMEGTGG